MEDPIAFALRIVRPMMRLAPTTFLDDTRRWLGDWGIQQAIAEHDTAAIFNWIVPLLAYQGIGDTAASRFVEGHDPISWRLIDAAMRSGPSCPRLPSYWRYHGCGYRKTAVTCAEPAHIANCFVPTLPLRKGALNQAVVALYLFLRDVCDGDFVAWIDARLAAADPGLVAPAGGRILGAALLEPLCHIAGTGPKLWGMILADLLLAADPARERWVTAGASLTAVDSLVHNLLSRTGILARFQAAHAYGTACYAPDGCVEVIEAIAAHIDASEFDPAFPAYFPRFVEKAIWGFAAENGRDICNGRRIDDQRRCQQVFCPNFLFCDRLPI